MESIKIQGSPRRQRVMQVEKVEFSEAFSPVSKHSTVRMILALMASHGWKRMCLDIKTALLKAPLDQELCVNQPEGSVVPGREGHIYLLLKALLGVHQACQLWNTFLSMFYTQLHSKVPMSTHFSTRTRWVNC